VSLNDFGFRLASRVQSYIDMEQVQFIDRAAALIHCTKEILGSGPTICPGILMLYGAYGRYLWIQGDIDGCRQLQRFAMEGWRELGMTQEMSYPLAMSYQVAACTNDDLLFSELEELPWVTDQQRNDLFVSVWRDCYLFKQLVGQERESYWTTIHTDRYKVETYLYTTLNARFVRAQLHHGETPNLSLLSQAILDDKPTSLAPIKLAELEFAYLQNNEVELLSIIDWFEHYKPQSSLMILSSLNTIDSASNQQRARHLLDRYMYG
jgi:hypothetical protein